MSEENKITPEEIERVYQKIKKDAENNGYYLNPDAQFAKDLVDGLLVNQNRFGYWACPCRLADGIKKNDVDIICPCDYRDQDINEYGACYCALYVSEKAYSEKKPVEAIPERRPTPEVRKKFEREGLRQGVFLPAYPIWRCKVCGYLCARDEAPELCPICKVKKERFERFA